MVIPIVESIEDQLNLSGWVCDRRNINSVSDECLIDLINFVLDEVLEQARKGLVEA